MTEDYYSGSSDGAFSQQFEPAGEGYIYRSRGVGRAVRVSAQEREAFLSAYGATIRLWAQICAVTGGSLALMALIFMDKGVFEAVGAWWLLAPGCAVAVFVIVYLYARTAPDRALAQRSTMLPALTREERLQTWLSSRSYWGIAFAPVMPSIAMFTTIYFRWPQNAPLTWMEYLAIAIGVVSIWLAGLNLFRKWWMERADAPREA